MRERQEEVQSVWRGFCHRQDIFERHDGLVSGSGRSIGATRDRPTQNRNGLTIALNQKWSSNWRLNRCMIKN